MEPPRLSLRPGLDLRIGKTRVELLGDCGAVRVLAPVPPEVGNALALLAEEGGEAAALARRVGDRGGVDALTRWYWCLWTLEDAGALRHSCRVNGESAAVLEAVAPSFRPDFTRPLPPGPRRLSRFALARVRGDGWVLESPLASARLLLLSTDAHRIIEAFAKPRTGDAPDESLSGVPVEVVHGVTALLEEGGFLTGILPDGSAEEDTDPDRGAWDFHDLLFHTRTRVGRFDGPLHRTRGGPGPFPEASVLRSPAGPLLDLEPPEGVDGSPPSLWTVLENRRSLRRHGDPPPTLREVGWFLHRVAAVREMRRGGLDPGVGEEPGTWEEATVRSYPSGGARYPLEIYLVVRRCQGLDQGVYRYAPGSHGLERVGGEHAARLLYAPYPWSWSVADDPPDGSPQLLLLLTARIRRTTLRYDGIAYSLILKEVGALMQSMYLVATAMGLASCALGCGSDTVLPGIIGTSFLEEPTVGEFMLGRPARSGPQGSWDPGTSA